MRIYMLLFALAMIGGCVSPQPARYFPPPTDYVPLEQIRIKSKFDTISLSKENLSTEENKCVPTIETNSDDMRKAINEFPRKNVITAVSHQSSSRVFIYRETTGLCLEYSANKYPIYAAETFINTANPSGVPPDITNNWYTEIAMQIALKGQAKIIYVTDKGTAFVVSYWSDEMGGYPLYYSSEFKKIGEWENIQANHKFSHPSLGGFSVTKRGKSQKMVKFFPLAQE